jgi:non-ribosomal peptide synthetase component F
MFTYLLGIFQALLYRYTLQSDFLIGYVTTTRQRKTRDVVGYFINTLPVRAHINQGSTLREIVMAASRNVRAGMAHRDLPLPEIVRALRLPRDPGRLSMFQVLFTMLAAYPPDPLFDLTTVGGDLMYGELQLSDFDVRQQEGQFDLTMELIEAGPVINGIIKYDTDLFSSKTIEDYVRHFVLLLKAAAADAGQRATDVSLADSREREWLLECSSGS